MPKAQSTPLTKHNHQRVTFARTTQEGPSSSNSTLPSTHKKSNPSPKTQSPPSHDGAARKARQPLERPEKDAFQARGRTIYNLHPEKSGPSLPQQQQRQASATPSGVDHWRNSTMNMGRRRSLLDETLTQAVSGKALLCDPSIHLIDASQAIIQGAPASMGDPPNNAAMLELLQTMLFPRASASDAFFDTASLAKSTPSHTWTQSTSSDSDLPAFVAQLGPLYQECQPSVDDDLFNMYINTAYCT